MRWPPEPEDRAAWSAAGGVVAAIFGAGAIAWWLATEPSSSDIPTWPAYLFASLAGAGVYCVLAPLLRVWPWRSDAARERHAGRITAGHSIKAGANIEAPFGIDAGRDIEAGGSIRAGKAETDRIALLRAQHSSGRALQRQLVYLGGVPETPTQAREAEDHARYLACKWGESAWRVISAHFPGHEREFFGDGSPALGATGFMLACQQEMAQATGGSADSYLERRLTLIESLLRQHGS